VGTFGSRGRGDREATVEQRTIHPPGKAFFSGSGATQRGGASKQSADPSAGLLLTFEEASPGLYVDLIGRVDIATVQHLHVLRDLPLSNITMIVLDLHGVDFCDGSGIRARLDLRNERLRLDRHVRISRVTVQVRSLLELVGVAQDLQQ
jgi:anti-anti-sigma regulatory factor